MRTLLKGLQLGRAERYADYPINGSSVFYSGPLPLPRLIGGMPDGNESGRIEVKADAHRGIVIGRPFRSSSPTYNLTVRHSPLGPIKLASIGKRQVSGLIEIDISAIVKQFVFINATDCVDGSKRRIIVDAEQKYPLRIMTAAKANAYNWILRITGNQPGAIHLTQDSGAITISDGLAEQNGVLVRVLKIGTRAGI
jgi:hypothetical protein